MKINRYISKINPKLYVFLLVISSIVYFAAIFIIQKLLNFQPAINDAYPGFTHIPEPLEIPLYLLGYIIIPLLALGLYYLHNYLSSKQITKFLYPILGLGVLVIGLKIISQVNLPSPSLFIIYFQTHTLGHALWLIFTKRLFVVLAASSIAIFSLVIFYFYKRPSLVWLKKVDQSKWKKIFIPIFLTLIGLIVFHPNFPSEEGYANYILIPAFEHIHGKALLYETVSLYGILNIYFVAWLGKLFLPLTYKGLSFVLFLSFWGFFVGVFYLVRNWLRSTSWAMLATWLALITSYFMLVDPFKTAFNFIGHSPYRQGFFIFPVLILLKYLHNKKSIWREFLILISSIAVFWNIETGLYISAATFATLGIDLYQNQRLKLLNFNWRKYLTRLLGLGLKFVFYLTLIFGVISLINLLAFGNLPNWYLQLKILTIFNGGYGKLPVPIFGTFLIFIVTYAIATVSILNKLIHRQSVDLVFAFLTFYGILSFIYYIGNSAWGVLNPVMVPLGLIWFYSLYNSLNTKTIISQRLTKSVFYALLVFMLVMTLAKLPVVFTYRDYSKISLVSIAPEDQNLYDDAQYINQHFPELERLALLHQNDKLLTYTDKPNLFYVQQDGQRLYSLYDDLFIIYKRQIQGLLNQVEEFKPPYIFISQVHDDRFTDFISGIESNYYLETKLKTLDIYKLQN